ncbi:DUF421 domain-containing protein [Niallia endozanthoxylica]|uniref:DUF421 domain-containing protein n=1 Tax=Niallia endozanthoxylica TaxID=2036016 RepID=A0A5J5GYS1_9BACI|nr:DUF421 domain-containing protein [Niallia endozanthoxylica]KAA9012534.1 DUF421 domain-containing protein [Niallia endozanthoxylica]
MTLLLKILTIYLITIAIMRLMGKSTIIQMTPYDLVAIIIVGTIASEPLISTEFWPTLYALAILTVFHLFFSWLTLSQFANRFFLGEPTLLIKKGVILEDNLEKSRLSVAQLLSILRSKGYPQIADVDYAMLEPIGEVSIIPKAENTPVTVQHMEISIDDEGLPISVIIDGKIQYRNLALLGKSKEWVMDYLDKNNVAVKDIIYGYVNEKSKKMYINRRSDKPD